MKDVAEGQKEAAAENDVHQVLAPGSGGHE